MSDTSPSTTVAPLPRTSSGDRDAGRLVVGVDGSPGAEQALRWAVREAAVSGPGLVLAALAFGPLGRPPELDTPGTLHVNELDSAAQSLLRDAVAQVRPLADAVTNPAVSTTTVYDEPIEGLVGLCRPSDELVLGSRGWGRVHRLLLGSIASQCLQLHTGTVVVVRGTVPPQDDRPVLVGVDGSPNSLEALRWAATYARRHGAPLRVVRAWSAPTSLHPSLRLLLDREREFNAARSEFRALVHSSLAEQDGDDQLPMTTLLVDGSPVAALTAASDEDVQLLVVGRGGPTALRRRPIGSTALGCALNAGTSVAVIASHPRPPSGVVMTRHDERTLGHHAANITAEVKAETYHETHLADPVVPAARTVRTYAEAEPDASTQPKPERERINRLDHNSIVVGVDGSECGRAALNWAAEEARRRGAELVVVAAWVPQGPMAGPLLAPGADLWAENVEATRNMLNEQVKPLQEMGVTFRTELVGGPPYESLEELSGDADLLVVGNHGRGGVARTFLGSVSRHVCRHARCPVVVVPQPPEPAR